VEADYPILEGFGGRRRALHASAAMRLDTTKSNKGIVLDCFMSPNARTCIADLALTG
jgi:hypothetical protein